MTTPETAKRISCLHVDNSAESAWRARQAQVEPDIEGLRRHAAADGFVAEMASCGVKPRQQIERLTT